MLHFHDHADDRTRDGNINGFTCGLEALMQANTAEACTDVTNRMNAAWAASLDPANTRGRGSVAMVDSGDGGPVLPCRAYSRSPTASPTTSPTELPSGLPTQLPTKSPTESPTTSDPTAAPTLGETTCVQ